MIEDVEIVRLAFDLAVAFRERTKRPKIAPTHVSLYCLPRDNEVSGDLVLKVHGRGSTLKIVQKAKADRMGGLFDCPEDREEVREVDLGEDWVLLYEHELPAWAVARILLDAEGEKDA